MSISDVLSMFLRYSEPKYLKELRHPDQRQGLFRKDGKRRGYGGVHIGPWKETDMLSGDQEVVHPITCMYNFLVSTKVSTEHVRFLPWTNMASTIARHCSFVSQPF